MDRRKAEPRTGSLNTYPSVDSVQQFERMDLASGAPRFNLIAIGRRGFSAMTLAVLCNRRPEKKTWAG